MPNGSWQYININKLDNFFSIRKNCVQQVLSASHHNEISVLWGASLMMEQKNSDRVQSLKSGESDQQLQYHIHVSPLVQDEICTPRRSNEAEYYRITSSIFNSLAQSSEYFTLI